VRSKGRLLYAGLLVIVVVIVWRLIAHSYRVAEEQRNALSIFSQSINLGMPRAEADRRCKQALATHAELRYDPNVEDFGASVALVSTPLTFGAKNWVAYFVFEEDVVAAVLVRTEDTRYDRPEGSPEDRVRDARKPWLVQFTPR
jgi:hypothetical protein